MKCVILQPSYIPWRGFFDQIQQADVFIFYDDVQYDKGGWRNRNQIKTPAGKQWLTIPVNTKGAVTDNLLIKDVQIVWNKQWNLEQFEILRRHYADAPYFQAHEPLLREFLVTRHDTLLADLTIDSTVAIARLLGNTHTQFLRSSELGIGGKRTDRLIDILRHVGADHYLSGPSAQSYIEADKFEAAGIQLDYFEYSYPEYPQLHGPYDPQVSILDLLFMTGPDAASYIPKTALTAKV